MDRAFGKTREYKGFDAELRYAMTTLTLIKNFVKRSEATVLQTGRDVTESSIATCIKLKPIATQVDYLEFVHLLHQQRGQVSERASE